MKRSIRVLGLALLACASVTAAHASPKVSMEPEAYVRELYARYAGHRTFDNLSQYSRGLKALFARNTRLLRGEVGDNNDGDEICQCQDWDHIRIDRLTLSPEAGGRVDAAVAFTDAGRREAVTLKLVRTQVGWRVDDVLHPRDGASPSLRARLDDENRRLAKRR